MGSMGLTIIIIAVCLVAMIVVLIRMRTTSEPAAENNVIEMESGVYEDVRAESHGIAIKTECNEAYNYATKSRLGH